jgi:hypothetical protein
MTIEESGRRRPTRTAPQRQSQGLVHNSGRDVRAAGHCRREVPFLQLLARPPLGDSGPHRRPRRGCATPGEPLHRTPSPTVGCAPVDGLPAGGAALQPAASRLPEAVKAPHRDAGEQRLLPLLVSQQVAQVNPLVYSLCGA